MRRIGRTKRLCVRLAILCAAAVVAPGLARGAAEAADEGPTYVGAARCDGCHEREAALWRGSHHDRAMERATAATVRGDFRDARFTKDGLTTTFFRRGDQFMVRTDGPDGELHDYRVAYTFGIEPLQQLLLELPGGRLQAFTVAWDTRPAAQGGQRWFDLHPGEKIDHADVLHWTGPAQNWNHMCADCHSTHVQKNYDAQIERFSTTWSDLDVACEACHGPGSRHVGWAEQAKASGGTPAPDGGARDRGLAFPLRDESGGGWAFAPGAPIAHRTKPPSSDAQLETCGRCHSRRAQVWSDVRAGEPLAASYRVSLLEPDLYQADGQVQDEVYEYGSFLQSKMHAAGVRCADCHDPHSLRPRAPGNALCTQCHAVATFDVAAHHFHESGSKGAQCVSCHMPERVYMVIDGRRDHSFRVPRPDLSEKLGTTNACNDCHAKESARWASAAIDRRLGGARTRTASFAEALHAGRTSQRQAGELLARVARDPALPPIARATAVEMLAAHLSPTTLPALRETLRDPDPLVRRAAARASASAPPDQRAALAAPLLRDPVRTVRLEALDGLLDAPPATLSSEQSADLARVVAEYRASQLQNADRADAQVNVATLDARLGDAAAARAAFATAIRLQPSFAPAYVNLADLERASGDERAAEAALRRGLAAAPNVAQLHHALGLSLVREKRGREALAELAKASDLAPADARYAYVYAVALHDGGEPARAIAVLERAQERSPGARDVLAALVQYAAEAGDRTAALRWATALRDATGDPQAAALVDRLRADVPIPGRFR